MNWTPTSVAIGIGVVAAGFALGRVLYDEVAKPLVRWIFSHPTV